MNVFELSTPALLIDADALDHNLATMAAQLPGSRLRPHVKRGDDVIDRWPIDLRGW